MSYVGSIKTYIRVYELGNMSAAARDQRISPAVASSRIAELERQLGVRLFNRTTRSLQPTQHGKVFYEGALKILEAINQAESAVANISKQPRGSIFVAAPLGVGRRFIAPAVPLFKENYPSINVRLRMSDRKIDLTGEGLDIAFILGPLEDSNLRLRSIAECERVLCASPAYIERKGFPNSGSDLITQNHDCLMHRFPGSTEFRWTLSTSDGPRLFDISGPFESDDGDVLTDWALDGRGIINKPVFEVARYIEYGSLVVVAQDTPPTKTFLSCLYPHKRLQDPKIRLFIDFMVQHCKAELARIAKPAA